MPRPSRSSKPPATRRAVTASSQKNGKSLSFTIINNGGFSDWVAAVNVIQSDLKAVGISGHAGQPVQHDLAVRPLHGQIPARVQLGLGRPDAVLRAAGTALLAQHRADRQVGGRRLGALHQQVDRRALRRSTPRRPTLPSSTRSSTSSSRSCSRDVPVIPVTEAVDWYQYDTQNIGGWVTPSDPYAQPGPVRLARLGGRAAAPVPRSSKARSGRAAWKLR